MKLVGRIRKLQVQREGLKVTNPEGSAVARRFDPAPLFEVSAIEVTARGVRGLGDERSTPIVDVHHMDHPTSKNADGMNGVSVGFTSHYAAMRDRFGAHLEDGIAGENIIVQADHAVPPDLAATGLLIETQSGPIVLERVVPAEPCLEFTRFSLRLEPSERSTEDVTNGLRFLREGTRGFYATVNGEGGIVRTGDEVFARD